MKKIFICILLTTIKTVIYGQNYSGTVIDKQTNIPIEYVSIGIIGKDIGTVSDEKGAFIFDINNQYNQDSIMFSCIGYESLIMNVSAYKKEETRTIILEQKVISLSEIVVIPSIFKEKIIGNKYRGKKMQGGFRENKKGFECGVLLNIKKRAILEKLTCNIASCTYDSVFNRVNVYKEVEKNSFENILDFPIYVKLKSDKSKRSLDLDLSTYDLMVEGNTLVTLEHIADMGEGHLLFSGGILKGSTCYYRKTSQGNWSKTPIKLGFNVTAKVEE